MLLTNWRTRATLAQPDSGLARLIAGETARGALRLVGLPLVLQVQGLMMPNATTLRSLRKPATLLCVADRSAELVDTPRPASTLTFMEVNLSCNLWSKKTVSGAARLLGVSHVELVETILVHSLRRQGVIA